MAEIYIHEVHTDLEITEGVGSLGPADVRKLVTLVLAHLKAQERNDELRGRDNRLQNGAYVSDVIR